MSPSNRAVSRRRSLRLQGEDPEPVEPIPKAHINRMPAEVLVRIMRLSLPRPNSPVDPAVYERSSLLLSYSLVCRHWHTWAAHDLKGEVQLPTTTTIDKLRQTIQHRAPRLAASVRCWTLHPSMLPSDTNGHKLQRDWTQFVVPLFTGLRELELTGCSLLHLASLSKCQNLHTLRLHRCSPESDELMSYSAPSWSFPSVEQLVITSPRNGLTSWENVLVARCFPALTSLSVGGDLRSIRSIAPLAQAISALPLTSLKIIDWSRTIYSSLKPLWSIWSAPLQHLTLNANMEDVTSVLTHLPRPLESITLLSGEGYIDWYCTHHNTLTIMHKLLSTSDAPAVRDMKQLVLHFAGSHNRSGVQKKCKGCTGGQSAAAKVKKALEARRGELVRLKPEPKSKK